MLYLYIARHGQTDWNAERRLQGSTNISLNETGRRQAAELAKSFVDIVLDRIYCSELSRSRETAEIVSGGRVPVETLPDLNEQAMGIFEGQFFDGRDPDILQEFRRRWSNPDDSLDGGESVNQHTSRIHKALEWIRMRNPSGRILIVGHGGTNRLLLRSLGVLDAGLQDNAQLHLVELP